MPRVADIYRRHTGIDATPNATIESADYNLNVADVEADLNYPRPIVAGGTGASNAVQARDNLDAEVASVQVTNYDSHVFESGSFWSAPGATGAPNPTYYFFGISVVAGANTSLTARAIGVPAPSPAYIKEKLNGVWGVWKADGADLYVDVAGDTMTGPLNAPVKGHTIGAIGTTPATSPMLYGDASIKIYDALSGTNWAGIGADGAGNMWFRTGTSGSPAPAFYVTGEGQFVTLLNEPTSAKHAATKAYADLRVLKAGDTMTGDLTVRGVTINNITIGGFNGDANCYFGVAIAPDRYLSFANQFHFKFTNSTGSLAYFSSSGNIFSCNHGTRNFEATVNGAKPGGGPWIDSSDARIKNVEGDYTRGLDAVMQLRPVYFTFKGNDTSDPPAAVDGAPDFSKPEAERQPAAKAVVVPYPNSSHYQPAVDGTQFAGLIAQEVESVFPEMVKKRAGYIDGAPVTDLRDLDTAPLVFALVNAIKALAARIEALEAAQATP